MGEILHIYSSIFSLIKMGLIWITNSDFTINLFKAACLKILLIPFHSRAEKTMHFSTHWSQWEVKMFDLYEMQAFEMLKYGF